MHFLFMAFLWCWFCEFVFDCIGKALPERQPTWIKGIDGEWYRPGDPRIGMAPNSNGTSRQTVTMSRVECSHCGHVMHITKGKRQQLRGQVMACPSCRVEKRFRP